MLRRLTRDEATFLPPDRLHVAIVRGVVEAVGRERDANAAKSRAIATALQALLVGVTGIAFQGAVLFVRALT